jgi:type I restriction enzyme M protein
MSPSAIVQKLWNYCNVLRDDGMSYGDYVEQLTYLLFLKMADERTKPPYLPASGAGKPTTVIPDKYSWPSLLKKDGDDLEAALEQFRLIASDLGSPAEGEPSV